MSCLPDCPCSKSSQDSDSADDLQAHDKSSYQPLSEASCLSEAIPLLPKDSAMIKYETNASQYELLAIIGRGLNCAATISLARHIPSGHRVAIRRINLDSSAEELCYIQQEILVTRQLRQENLVPFLCSFVCNNEIWVVMPLLAFGSTRDLLISHFPTGFPELAIAFILRDVLAALSYLHRRGFIHRSIKGSHILISGTGRALLSGLRYSCSVVSNGRWQPVIHAFPHDCTSNLNWLSPELLEQSLFGYNCKSDIYSLGITACELANGIVPFASIPPTQMLLAKLQGYTPHLLDARTYGNGRSEDAQMDNQGHKIGNSSYDRLFTEAFHSFVELCLQRDPYRRPTAAQLSNQSFIRGCKKASIKLLDVLAPVTPVTEMATLLDDANSEAPTSQMEELDLDESWNF